MLVFIPLAPEGFVGFHVLIVSGRPEYRGGQLHSAPSSLACVKTARACVECSSKALGCACSVEQRVSSACKEPALMFSWANFLNWYHHQNPVHQPFFWVSAGAQGHKRLKESFLFGESTLELRKCLLALHTARLDVPSKGLPSPALEEGSDRLQREEEGSGRPLREEDGSGRPLREEDRSGRPLNEIPELNCLECKIYFTRPSSLKRHMMNTHGHMTVKCDRCDSQFSNRYNLHRHVENVHLKSASFECSVCGKTLGSKYSASLHMERKHGLGRRRTPIPSLPLLPAPAPPTSHVVDLTRVDGTPSNPADLSLNLERTADSG